MLRWDNPFTNFSKMGQPLYNDMTHERPKDDVEW